ncbi:uncharacterized protein AKAW2_20477S [Aspergillus luchuensis]|uniref:Short chain dehydrogenase/oxidoreductase n=1 Tax=Aspergillus kawachii TaxID=1069201 RepID=A0A146FQ81_ASPKA|nr:uncharacterized protein AKAW2_20477S [Aspergillus luchuensis]BCR95537.1 hypothetical protein AKAW2_20477S [Aspergillus luchuensis]BCS08077.1 hypothetical protein ALUC_20447S [Aspergillus luchuensis]GAT27459.1 short chain dehydrogenase/oxidoreductase [Aspergillus luchuensis]
MDIEVRSDLDPWKGASHSESELRPLQRRLTGRNATTGVGWEESEIEHSTIKLTKFTFNLGVWVHSLMPREHTPPRPGLERKPQRVKSRTMRHSKPGRKAARRVFNFVL